VKQQQLKCKMLLLMIMNSLQLHLLLLLISRQLVTNVHAALDHVADAQLEESDEYSDCNTGLLRLIEWMDCNVL
jgi:hypothetical protein